MKERLLLLLFCITVIIPFNSSAQRQLITGTYNNVPFDNFIKSIEEQTHYKFYFNPSWTDSVAITVTAENKTIQDLLQEALSGSELNFAVDDQNRIYITKSREILSTLPANFFNTDTTTPRETIAFDYSEYEKKEKQKKLAEDKLYNIGNKTGNLQGTATIAGNIRDAASGEPVIGAAVFVENPTIGVATDQFGYYSLTLPKGRHEIKIKSVGMKNSKRYIMLYSDGKLDIEIDEDVTPLKEVVIESERDVRVTGMQMGMEKLDIKTMKQMPLALGETDIMKVMLTLPGVQSVGEGTAGINVRGGATNQNLILFNDAVVYNPSHLFGFFSTFNPDVLKNVELYKSGITADYGGRLSSVLDVHGREGNMKKFSGAGGISPITGRLTLEGPIIKDKLSFIVGGRSTYSNWLLRQLDQKELKNSSASFYDLTANVTYRMNDNNNFYLSAYTSQDKFKLDNDTTYNYQDRNASIKWKHVFNNKLFGVLTGAYSEYNNKMESTKNPVNAFTFDFSVKQLTAKTDFSYIPNAKHTITAGVSLTRYYISPGNFQPSFSSEESLIKPNKLAEENGLESAVYIGENYEVNQKLSIYGGIRYSLYNYLGPKTVNVYSPGLPLEVDNITDTINYNRGKNIVGYGGFEPRVSMRYLLPANSSIKVSYNRMRQYIQMLSNTAAITPTDIWKLSDPYIKPQIGDQYSFGFYKNFKGNLIETSIETYYKNMLSTVDYKNGAILFLNPELETDVVNAKGKTYGIEVMVKKNAGKLNGWISYTYSRSLLQTKGNFSSEVINRGEYYPSNFDKPHAANFIGNYKFSRRFNFSLNLVYSTGRPITLPIAKFEADGSPRIYFSDRNQFRIPAYFRTDISINIEGNHKIRKLAHSSWTFAVYNLTGRKNVYSIFFVSDENQIKGYKLSVFARPIPTITYNFKF